MRVAFIVASLEACVELINNSAKMALQHPAESREPAVGERGDGNFKIEPQTMERCGSFSVPHK